MLQANPADQQFIVEQADNAQPTVVPPPQQQRPPSPPPQQQQAPAAATAGGVSESDVASLEALGFERAAAVIALQNDGHNLEQAANWLFSQ